MHARRQSFSTYEEIAATLLANWSWGEERSAREVIQSFGSRWSDAEVEAAFWKLAGDTAAKGHLLVDLAVVELSLSTPLTLLDPSTPPILPDPLPSQLEPATDDLSPIHDTHAAEPATQGIISGPTFDASTLESAEIRDRFHHNLAAVMAVHRTFLHSRGKC